MKGYKVFDENWKCQGFQFKVGETYIHKGKISMCSSGFHFCEKVTNCFNYKNFDPNNKIAEIEADENNIILGNDKHCTGKITIIREISWEEMLKLANIGDYNSGCNNSGNCNSGDYNSGCNNSGCNNSGDYNSGDYNPGCNNSGDYNSGCNNSGDCNSGYNNSGDYNSGCNNSGDYNSGYRNSGNCNSGNCNSGYYNSGYNNSGYRNPGCNNSGDYNSGCNNSGDCNSGDYNSGDYNSGMFNTNEPMMRIFNKESNITLTEFCNSNKFINFNLVLTEWKQPKTIKEKEKYPNGYLKVYEYKEAWKNWWKINKSKNMIKSIKELPNFDAVIFKEITGITIK